jgi:hypothetical protein
MTSDPNRARRFGLSNPSTRAVTARAAVGETSHRPLDDWTSRLRPEQPKTNPT